MTAEAKEIPSWLYSLRWIPTWTPGKSRVCNRVINWANLKGSIRIRTKNLTIETPSIEETISKYLIFDGIYDNDTYHILLRFLKKNSVFLDIGANVGLFSLLAARNICPEGAVYSVEAAPSIYGFLKRNKEANPVSNITIYHNAAHKTSGEEVRFFEAPESKFGMGSLYNRPGSRQVTVKTLAVDDLILNEGIKKVDLIKIDIEGYEVNAFRGAEKLLSRPDAPPIIFEFNDWGETPEKIGAPPGEAQRYLRSLGYHTQAVEKWLKKPDPNTEVITKGGANIVAWKS